ncbi:unnamed protein product [Pleuronectes platessa]|uniref:Uncharacterized protein n=1 Tax=Pleuronectes platessa TaxID=8262 RepID=A0A9N7YS85_PLEPL|nr:unnamed protein product [Pleuronectes platessa]
MFKFTMASLKYANEGSRGKRRVRLNGALRMCGVPRRRESRPARRTQTDTASPLRCRTSHHTHKAVNQELSSLAFVMEPELCGWVLRVIDGSGSLSDCEEHPSLSVAC